MAASSLADSESSPYRRFDPTVSEGSLLSHTFPSPPPPSAPLLPSPPTAPSLSTPLAESTLPGASESLLGDEAACSMHGDRFRDFRAVVARQTITLGLDDAPWVYYNHGPREHKGAVAVLLHGVEGTANTFYEQVLVLGAKGVRVIAAQYPPLRTHAAWAVSFDNFLSHMRVD